MTKDKIVKILDDYAKGVINKKSLNIFADNLISNGLEFKEKTKAEFSETLIDWMVNQSEVFLDIDTVSQIIMKIKEMINERP